MRSFSMPDTIIGQCLSPIIPIVERNLIVINSGGCFMYEVGLKNWYPFGFNIKKTIIHIVLSRYTKTYGYDLHVIAEIVRKFCAFT